MCTVESHLKEIVSLVFDFLTSFRSSAKILAAAKAPLSTNKPRERDEQVFFEGEHFIDLNICGSDTAH